MATRKIRPVRVEGNVAYIPLTQGYEAIIDADDVPLVEHLQWHASPIRTNTYALAATWVNGKTKLVRLHRIIMRPADGQVVDHIDGDGLNNRRSNLRFASHQQNNCNSKRRADNRSGVKGVFWDKQRRKWQAQISVGGRSIALGRFASLDAAAAAYADASQRLHGEFGRTVVEAAPRLQGKIDRAVAEAADGVEQVKREVG